ncbi:ATP-binding cassette domain-containing protein [Alloprevotella tannerae]|uniref:ATP-binding cassette domain-containing protein n=1 Tax=Alloprevotella tannerae TaxID=76122 RepID=UPI0028F09711|nr:ATP-binding cassette domain-containing protein [Alloprevotella tannerae]
MNAIEVKHISKRYGATVALDDCSFSVPQGALYGLIGPDGTGKTTMFRILATLLLPDSGTATIDGYDTVNDMRAIRRRLGYMPGRFSLYQDLTVEENLRFFATLFGTTIEEGFDDIKDIYGQIERFKDRRAGALSGGMKQKLALSCALIHRPSVLLLDEPTTGVDPVSRIDFWDMLGTLKRRGITMLVSTPYEDEIKKCDEIILTRPTTTPAPDFITTASAYIKEQETEAATKDATDVNVISVNHLVKAFGSFRAVDDISFTVRRGEIFGFLGANGAGKTTAMRILSGLSRPTSGTAIVGGYDVRTQYEEIKRHIGYMSQKFSLYEDMTVRENIRLFGGIYGMRDQAIRRKTDELLDKLDIAQYADRLVALLPLGFKQKLAFSVSIFHSPEVVFLDEPTGGVDGTTRRQFWQLIYQAAAKGITIFVTTHYMDEAEYCDRISIMVDGKIRALGTPDELKSRFEKETLGEVFTLLARRAERKET